LATTQQVAKSSQQLKSSTILKTTVPLPPSASLHTMPVSCLFHGIALHYCIAFSPMAIH
jgi:hypothetical protein